MKDETNQARHSLVFSAIALNIVAWGSYLYLTEVVGIDFESIRQAKLAGCPLPPTRADQTTHPLRFTQPLPCPFSSNTTKDLPGPGSSINFRMQYNGSSLLERGLVITFP